METSNWRTRYGLFIILCVSITRTIRWPNDWASATWLVNYDYGVVKRGLPGSILQNLLTPENAQTVVNLTASAWTATWALTLIAISWKILEISRRGNFDYRPALVLAALFASSYTVMGAHTTGYYDSIIFTLAAAACWGAIHGKYLAAGLLLAVGVLCHEIILLYGLPAVVFAVLVKNQTEKESTILWRITRLLTPAALTFGLMLMLRTEVTPQEWIRNMTAVLKEHGMTQSLHLQALNSITLSFTRVWEQQSVHFWRLITSHPYPLQIGLPLVAMIALIKRRLPETSGSALGLAAVATILAPLAIHAIAWDTSRIWTFPLGNALLAVWAVYQLNPKPDKKEMTAPWIGLIAAAIAMAISSETPLMDNEKMRGEFQTVFVGYALGMALIVWDIHRNLERKNENQTLRLS